LIRAIGTETPLERIGEALERMERGMSMGRERMERGMSMGRIFLIP